MSQINWCQTVREAKRKRASSSTSPSSVTISIVILSSPYTPSSTPFSNEERVCSQWGFPLGEVTTKGFGWGRCNEELTHETVGETTSEEEAIEGVGCVGSDCCWGVEVVFAIAAGLRGVLLGLTAGCCCSLSKLGFEIGLLRLDGILGDMDGDLDDADNFEFWLFGVLSDGDATEREDVRGMMVRSGVLFCGITVVDGEGALGRIRLLVCEGGVILIRDGWAEDFLVNVD